MTDDPTMSPYWPVIKTRLEKSVRGLGPTRRFHWIAEMKSANMRLDVEKAAEAFAHDSEIIPQALMAYETIIARYLPEDDRPEHLSTHIKYACEASAQEARHALAHLEGVKAELNTHPGGYTLRIYYPTHLAVAVATTLFDPQGGESVL